ncbi:MAG: Rdx family protein [Thermomicrobiales bacterium]|nr:Rdx family protein [Thermomicrobiales bacterium]
MSPLHLVIQYDPAQGDEDAALALARRLFARFDEAIDSLALIPAAEADFALYWNDRLVCSQRATGKAPQVADLLALLRQTAQSGS